MKDKIFKKRAFGGFDRDDVIAYIDSIIAEKSEMQGDYENQIEELSENLQTLIEINKELIEKNDELKLEVAKGKSQLSVNESTIERIYGEQRSQRDEHNRLRLEYNTAQNDIMKLREENEEEKAKIKNLEGEIVNLKSRDYELNKKKEELYISAKAMIDEANEKALQIENEAKSRVRELTEQSKAYKNRIEDEARKNAGEIVERASKEAESVVQSAEITAKSRARMQSQWVKDAVFKAKKEQENIKAQKNELAKDFIKIRESYILLADDLYKKAKVIEDMQKGDFEITARREEGGSIVSTLLKKVEDIFNV